MRACGDDIDLHLRRGSREGCINAPYAELNLPYHAATVYALPDQRRTIKQTADYLYPSRDAGAEPVDRARARPPVEGFDKAIVNRLDRH